jgi:hypothetical protein
MEFPPLQANSRNGNKRQVTTRSAVLSRIYQLPVTAVLRAPEAAFPSLRSRFRHRHHATDAVMAPDILFNTGTLQRTYNLSAFITCFQVFTAVVYQMVILFQVSAACIC